MSMRTYLVMFLYREPTYAKARGIDELDYRASFEVSASDPVTAEQQARRRFADATARATVSWVRQIVFTKVLELA